MLIGQECKVLATADRTYSVAVGGLGTSLNNVVVNETEQTKILSVRHHKKRRVMVKISLENDNFVIVGYDTMFQIVEDNIASFVDARGIKKGQFICPPIPPYCNPADWAKAYGFRVKSRDQIMCKVSTIVFDKCEYVVINHVPILHDNHEYKTIRKVAKKSNSVAQLLLHMN